MTRTVAAHSARARTRELAIRAALGARRRDLASLLVGSEIWPVVSGIAIGLSGAYLMAPVIFGTPFETSPRDTMAFAAAAAAVLALSVLASYVPVRRATAANPAGVLRLT